MESLATCIIIFHDTGNVVKDEQIILVELGYRSVELELLPRYDWCF